MLNKNGERMLAYTAVIDRVLPIEGADRIELAFVNAWSLIVKKGEFNGGDRCVYFEIDSKLPEAAWSEFMESKHYKVKTMKLGKFGVISQGLCLPIDAFEGIQIPDGIYADCTQLLGVTYADAEDNDRKAPSVNPVKVMMQRRPKLFKNPMIAHMMRYTWFQKIMLRLFGRKRNKNGWPEWVVKTDEERIQNMPYILNDATYGNQPWIATEKIDGTSTTFTYKRKGPRKGFYVCSRNVVFDKPDKGCFYDSNVYWEMARKYNVEEILKRYADAIDAEFVTLQGETYGEKIQKRDYGMKGHDFRGFNLITEKGRMNSYEAMEIMEGFGIPWVPILDVEYKLPNTVDEILAYAAGPSVIDCGMREGVVFRTQDGSRSFKAVDNAFLLKYHG